MDRLHIKEGAWVVVCDGAKAIVLENIGDADYPDLRMREAEEQPDRRTHEIGTDAPGRAFRTVGSARSALAQTDFHDESERTFLTDLARRLDKALSEKETASVVIVAPPRALGMLRNAYSPRLRKAVAAEVDKDLVAMPIGDIERHLLGKKR
jgi:protein required for attachment to host cells